MINVYARGPVRLTESTGPDGVRLSVTIDDRHTSDDIRRLNRELLEHGVALETSAE